MQIAKNWYKNDGMWKHHGDNPYPAKLIYIQFQPLEVVSRQGLEVAENYSYLLILAPNIYKFWCLNTHYFPNKSDLIG